MHKVKSLFHSYEFRLIIDFPVTIKKKISKKHLSHKLFLCHNKISVCYKIVCIAQDYLYSVEHDISTVYAL